jgi:glucose/mannose-6-phosphate isomerase
VRGRASAAARLRTGRSLAAESGVRRMSDDGRPRSLVVVGTGTAAHAGDMAAAVLGSGCPVPVVTVRDYRLPGWVAGHDLVVAVASTSGQAAERTARVAADAVRRGCRFIAIGPVGGPLAPLAEQARAPHIGLPEPADPADLPWGPAAALLTAASAVGLGDLADDGHEAAAARLEAVAAACRPDAETWENPAKSLAVDLAGTLPVIWGATPVAAAAARYFASQAMAVARYPAVCGRPPDALFDQLAATDGPFGGAGPRSIFDDPDEDGGTRLRLVLLRDPAEPPEAAADLADAAAAARARGVDVSEPAAPDGHAWERLAGLIALTDYATVYLAVAYGAIR